MHPAFAFQKKISRGTYKRPSNPTLSAPEYAYWQHAQLPYLCPYISLGGVQTCQPAPACHSSCTSRSQWPWQGGSARTHPLGPCFHAGGPEARSELPAAAAAAANVASCSRLPPISGFCCEHARQVCRYLQPPAAASSGEPCARSATLLFVHKGGLSVHIHCSTE